MMQLCFVIISINSIKLYVMGIHYNRFTEAISVDTYMYNAWFYGTDENKSQTFLTVLVCIYDG